MSSKYLSLSQRVGGAMSVGATNASAKDYNNVKEFKQPFNVSSGAGMKVKKVKGGKVVDGCKKTKAPSAYNKFVKANYSKAVHLPPKERLGYIAGLWRDSKK